MSKDLTNFHLTIPKLTLDEDKAIWPQIEDYLNTTLRLMIQQNGYVTDVSSLPVRALATIISELPVGVTGHYCVLHSNGCKKLTGGPPPTGARICNYLLEDTDLGIWTCLQMPQRQWFRLPG